MLRQFTSLYMPSYPTVLVYMLQSTEYQLDDYLGWLRRTKDFSTVMQRRTLDKTRASRLLLLGLRLGIVVQIVAGLLMVYFDLNNQFVGGTMFGLALIIVYPFVWAYLLALFVVVGKVLIRGSQQARIEQATKIFDDFSGVTVAVAGSYGKTTMKELLLTVLSEGKKVAATPANKNVSISHARFAENLKGDEEILIIEYGEGAPGDVAKFAQSTKPTDVVITGLAPAHLNRYKTLQAAGEDIFSATKYVPADHVYVNGESSSAVSFIKKGNQVFDEKSVLGWKVSKVKIELSGISFEMHKGTQTLKLESGLVGEHQVSFLAFVAAFTLQSGLTKAQVIEGIAKTAPFEHRMQPYQLAGAWIVDDTYNGNIEGIRVGTRLLKDIPAKRKIYVTPGLVEQGEEAERVHKEMGKLIADAKPDMVVLMQNSTTELIKSGLKSNGFTGEIKVEDKPLDFYTNLQHFVAHGDLVVMQNDWTDNYA